MCRSVGQPSPGGFTVLPSLLVQMMDWTELCVMVKSWVSDLTSALNSSTSSSLTCLLLQFLNCAGCSLTFSDKHLRPSQNNCIYTEIRSVTSGLYLLIGILLSTNGSTNGLLMDVKYKYIQLLSLFKNTDCFFHLRIMWDPNTLHWHLWLSWNKIRIFSRHYK